MDPEAQGIKPLAVSGPEKPFKGGRHRKGYKVEDTRSGKKKLLYCCGVCTIIWVVIIIVLIILIFTVFKQKDPSINVTSVTLKGLDFNIGNILTNPNPSVDIDLGINASVHNPNYAGFKYHNTTLYIFYHGKVVADAVIDQGEIKSRKTSNVSTTVEIKLSSALINSNLTSDITDGTIPLVAQVQVKGTAKILNFIEVKNVRSRAVCDVDVFLSNQTEAYDCDTKVKL